MSILVAELLVGEWRPKPTANGELYEFMQDRDICIYTDWSYPKAEAAIYELKDIDGKNILEIKHPTHPIAPELYEITEIGEHYMIWEYTKDDEVKRIKLERYFGTDKLPKEL